MLASKQILLRLERGLRRASRAVRLIGIPLFGLQNGFALLRGRTCVVGSGTADTRYCLTAVVRVKDEAPFISEWLDHHVRLGVEHFFIYDNGSVDGTREAIASSSHSHLTTVIDWPAVPASPECYHHFFSAYGSLSEWCMFLDLDEFVVGDVWMSLPELLRSARGPALALNWRYMGSSWCSSLAGSPVTTTLLRGDRELNDHVKVIARPQLVRRCRNSHSFYYVGGALARTIDGRRVFGSFVTPRSSPIWINHYVYRGRDDYVRKLVRSSVDGFGQRLPARAMDLVEIEFDRHNEIVILPAERYFKTSG